MLRCKKLKKLSGILLAMIMAVGLLVGYQPTEVDAFSSSEKGFIRVAPYSENMTLDSFNDAIATFEYSASGVLTISALTGDFEISNWYEPDSNINFGAAFCTAKTGTAKFSKLKYDDVKCVIFKNFSGKRIVGTGTSQGHTILEPFKNLTSVKFEGTAPIEIGGLYGGKTDSVIDSVYIPDGVTTLSDGAFMHNSVGVLNIYIPDSVVNMTDDCINSASDLVKITCSRGSIPYAYAKDKGYGLELADQQASCTATVSNSISWNIFAPEDINLAYTSTGYAGTTWLGIAGVVPTSVDLYITTDDNFDISGQATPDIQKVKVVSSDSNTTVENKKIITKIDSDKFTAGQTERHVFGGDRRAYWIDYTCSIDYSSMTKQDYQGTMNFIISEKLK